MVTKEHGKNKAFYDNQWQSGQSGNPNGRPPNSVTTLLKNRTPGDNQKVADKLYQLALDGDMSAIREYIDRTDGKVTEKHLFAGLISTVTPETLETAQKRLVFSVFTSYHKVTSYSYSLEL